MPRHAGESEPTPRGQQPASPGERADLAEQPTLHADSGQLESLAAVPADWQGREVQGRYRVGDKLGEGGMGMVYAAEHVHLRKKVAFKVIHPSLAANEELLERFTREALATGQLEHPHICAAIDFEQLEDGSAFLVMPFVGGHSLQAELDRHGPLPWRTACRYGAQIADALSAAHAVGIVHRDLKPDNVLVERLPDGSRAIKVLDFGVASLSGAPQSLRHIEGKPLTQAGMILGTPGYMSPEQATAGEVDGRTDLYALGVMLWEALAGRRLFDGDDVTQIFARQFQGAPPVPGLDPVGPPAELAALTQRLLSAEKEQRPRTATEVRDALRRLAEAPEPNAVQRTGAQGARLVRERWRQASPRLRRGLSAAAAVALAALLWLGLADDEPGARRQAGAAGQTATAGERPRPAETNGERPDQPSGHADSLADDVQALFGGLPKKLAEARDTLLEDESRTERLPAAKLVAEHAPAEEVPPYLSLVAELELASGCRAKRAVVRKLTELGDSAALPALKRLDETPRRSCGAFNLRDCYGCMRRDIAQALEALE